MKLNKDYQTCKADLQTDRQTCQDELKTCKAGLQKCNLISGRRGENIVAEQEKNDQLREKIAELEDTIKKLKP